VAAQGRAALPDAAQFPLERIGPGPGTGSVMMSRSSVANSARVAARRSLA
jgi:hypothetical protein